MKPFRNHRFSLPLALVLAGLVHSSTARAAGSPAGASLAAAIRRADHAAVRAVLAGSDGPAAVNARDEAGNTPLMTAGLWADAAMIRLLLAAGADVNATNLAGATALMRAATDETAVRLLVEKGADVKASSALGNSALIIAARPYGSMRTVKFLLDHGAEVNATNALGATALMAAVAGGDADTVRLLLDRGADVNRQPALTGDGFILGGGRTALMWAAFRGREDLVRLLLARGARVNDFTIAGSALTQAAWAGNAAIARILLDAGASVDARDLVGNFTPLHWAASSEHADDALVRLLLARGADVNAEGGQPVDGFLGVAQTPLILARKRGDTPIVRALLQAGAREPAPVAAKSAPRRAWPVTGPIDDAQLAAAIQLAVPTLQKTAIESPVAFVRHASKQGCISCHQQELPLAAVCLARSRNLAVDAAALRQEAAAVEGFGGYFQERDLQTTFHPEPAVGNGYALFSLHLQGQPASPVTDSLVHQLLVIQAPDGHWSWNLPRPPIQSSDFGATALAVKALAAYPVPGRQREITGRIQRARSWLAKARPESIEERAYQLLGLAWAGEAAGPLQKFADALVREQRSDGGWGQLGTLPTDAFATGQSLYALRQSGVIPAGHPAVRNGARFLLQTQLADGTWHVRRRAFPFQPPMDSAFPHGADAWISAAGTSWAVMALSAAIEPVATAPAPALTLAGGAKPGTPAQDSAPGTPAPGATPVNFVTDIKPVLERSCVACHSGERPKAAYRMESRDAFLKGGNRGEAAVIPGEGSRSVLLHLVTDRVEDLEMPPLGKRDRFPSLSQDEVSRLESWIAQGAAWPEGVNLRPPGARN